MAERISKGLCGIPRKLGGPSCHCQHIPGAPVPNLSRIELRTNLYNVGQLRACCLQAYKEGLKNFTSTASLYRYLYQTVYKTSDVVWGPLRVTVCCGLSITSSSQGQLSTSMCQATTL